MKHLNYKKVGGWFTLLLILWGFFYLTIPGIVIDPTGRRLLAALFAIVISIFTLLVQVLVFPKIGNWSIAGQLWMKAFLYAAAGLSGFLVVLLIQWQLFVPSELLRGSLSFRFFHMLSLLFSAPFSEQNWSEAIPVGLVSQFSAFLVLLMLIAISGMVIAGIDTRWRALQTEKQLQAQRLKMMEMQMQPHFLFNTLNAITSVVQSDPPKAEQLLISLSDFLRYNFKSGQLRQIPLQDEWEFTRQYLQLMQARYGKQLKWQMDSPGPCGNCKVPPLSLQPLAENAIQYALQANDSGAEIGIQARMDEYHCNIEVFDNGPGFANINDRAFPPAGHALSHLVKRLKLLYGKSAGLEFTNRDAGGALVQLRLPIETSVS